VAGAARGLGLTVARALLESGSSVYALDLLSEPAEPAWSEALKVASERGVSLTYQTLDVTNSEQVHDVFAQCFDAAPPIAPVRGLFVTAGIQLMLPAIDYPADKFRKVIDVNLTGNFLCAQAFARQWTKRHPAAGNAEDGAEDSLEKGETASIVLTASMSGSVANFGIECTPYNASKAAVVQIGRNLAMEWGKKGIRVNVSSNQPRMADPLTVWVDPVTRLCGSTAMVQPRGKLMSRSVRL
jgi:NAD(P)-dependent dehydrogenase (short-subunit alcohol dehydrogenase family)